MLWESSLSWSLEFPQSYTVSELLLTEHKAGSERHKVGNGPGCHSPPLWVPTSACAWRGPGVGAESRGRGGGRHAAPTHCVLSVRTPDAVSRTMEGFRRRNTDPDGGRSRFRRWEPRRADGLGPGQQRPGPEGAVEAVPGRWHRQVWGLHVDQ